MKKITSIEDAKEKKKSEIKEALKDPYEVIIDRINMLQTRVAQFIDIEHKLMTKVGDLECRLDQHGYPAGTSHWAGFKFNQDGTMVKQETDKFTENKSHLYAE